MNRLSIVIGLCLGLLCGQALAQEVFIPDFPIGVASSAGNGFFDPYLPQLRVVADTLKKYPEVQAIVTGSADGYRYRLQNDAKNPGLALGRAHALAKLLMQDLGVDSAQLIIQSQNVADTGATYRFASVRVQRGLIDLTARIDDGQARLNARIDSLENRPPVEQHFTEIREVPSSFSEEFGLQFGVGFSSSPFGGMPVVNIAGTWKRFAYVEIIGGHSLWNSDFEFDGENLDTRRRMFGGHITVFPFEEFRVGFVGGWMRIEKISQFYYEYVGLSEGPMFGLRFDPTKFISIVGAYNPAKRRDAGIERSHTDTDQFMVYATIYRLMGGGK